MILTCPACDTKYVVKDDAIPPGGRQVRCASCKHSWHQEPEVLVAEPATAADIDFGGTPPEAFGEPVAETLQAAAEGSLVAEEPQSDIDDGGQSAWGEVAEEPVTEPPVLHGGDNVAMEEAPAVADEWRAPASVEEPSVEEDFVGYAPITEDGEAPRRRWPLLLAILAVIIAAAAAFWFFAPSEWKARAGIAQAGATPLQLMITTSDRQPLESGNELVAISGRVINPTDKEQNVPPIRAELRDKATRTLVHRWTIAPPARVLAPRSSASFNSAEVDVPKGGDELTVTLEQ
ncbi:zinc-ribbon domain-containing protein [Sphingomonas sp. G124]|uniref:Zinc-ribbon domain-containing protein n=1 Tax=Sphingomonas cremea TaxID=2904799 RepID=A0A9X1U589_9SPHN|nr:zinc-ribbon domain-containing protein [Sphingomonas cremea]MCF2514946.1 zinc-ribbon domain-containing protein [Sphingomonas cremea]